MINIALESIQKITPPPSIYRGYVKAPRKIINTTEVTICSQVEVKWASNEMLA